MNLPTRLVRVSCAWLACAGLLSCTGGDESRDDAWSPSVPGDAGQSPADSAVPTATDAGSPVNDGGVVSPPRDAGTTTSNDGGAILPPSDGGARTDAGGGAGPDAAAAGDASVQPGSMFPPVADPNATGPYKTKTVNSTGPGSKYTIFQPDPLGPDGLKHPVLTWGNGGGTTPSVYSGILSHLASHGFVVIASNTAPMIRQQVALGKEMVAGVDWILMQNETSGSAYFGKLDKEHVAPFGYSMGGLATTTIVGDPRFTTTVHLSGGTGTMSNVKTLLAMAHAPMLWQCGDTDIAKSNCDMDFTNVTTQSVFYGTLIGAGHTAIQEGNKEIPRAFTAWFRYYLMNDQSYKSMFVGADCKLCKDSKWQVVKKNYE